MHKHAAVGGTEHAKIKRHTANQKRLLELEGGGDRAEQPKKAARAGCEGKKKPGVASQKASGPKRPAKKREAPAQQAADEDGTTVEMQSSRRRPGRKTAALCGPYVGAAIPLQCKSLTLTTC